jgi:hypothetical protein
VTSDRFVPLRAGDERYLRIRRALLARPRKRTELPHAPPRSLPRSSAARTFWSQRAWSELAAVPAMAQTSLAVMRAKGPLDALHILAVIGADEVRHTEIARHIADELGGYVDTIPEGSGFRPNALAEPYDLPLPFWALSNGCVSETLSLELMRARLPYIRDPYLHGVVSEVMRDESIHARLSWLLAAEIFPALDRLSREELAEYARDAWAVMARTFVTRELPPDDRRAERRLRNAVAKAGLGAAPCDVEDAAFLHVRDELVLPRLRKLGLPL